MRKPNNLYLVGPMGAGKSTIGRQLATELNMEFFDTDQEIEARSGADVAWIYDVEGEEGFRLREEKVINELTDKQNIVLATGGGAILSTDNRARLAARGVVVYLTVSVDQQLKRLARDKKRPLLQNNDDPEPDLIQMMADRELLYKEVADMVVATDDRSVRSVATEILRNLEQSLI